MEKIKEVAVKLNSLLDHTKEALNKIPAGQLDLKPTVEKWSRKEILGHLIDSAINNLQRFTEIQFESKPYRIVNYNPDELVRANHYQQTDMTALLALWLNINRQIIKVIDYQTPQSLNYEIVLPDGATSDLRFLIEDYVDHMQHHLEQILS